MISMLQSTKNMLLIYFIYMLQTTNFSSFLAHFTSMNISHLKITIEYIVIFISSCTSLVHSPKYYYMF